MTTNQKSRFFTYETGVVLMMFFLFGIVSAGERGLIIAAIGFGSFVWGLNGPALSDKIGRKPTLIIFCIVACSSPLVLVLIQGSLGVSD